MIALNAGEEITDVKNEIIELKEALNESNQKISKYKEYVLYFDKFINLVNDFEEYKVDAEYKYKELEEKLKESKAEITKYSNLIKDFEEYKIDVEYKYEELEEKHFKEILELGICKDKLQVMCDDKEYLIDKLERELETERAERKELEEKCNDKYNLYVDKVTEYHDKLKELMKLKEEYDDMYERLIRLKEKEVKYKPSEELLYASVKELRRRNKIFQLSDLNMENCEFYEIDDVELMIRNEKLFVYFFKPSNTYIGKACYVSSERILYEVNDDFKLQRVIYKGKVQRV